jgi:hypothetical protein
VDNHGTKLNAEHRGTFRDRSSLRQKCGRQGPHNKFSSNLNAEVMATSALLKKFHHCMRGPQQTVSGRTGDYSQQPSNSNKC